jgi:hypothetical protein
MMLKYCYIILPGCEISESGKEEETHIIDGLAIVPVGKKYYGK